MYNYKIQCRISLGMPWFDWRSDDSKEPFVTTFKDVAVYMKKELEKQHNQCEWQIVFSEQPIWQVLRG